jgi:predicted ArsR family transcriptional regulator
MVILYNTQGRFLMQSTRQNIVELLKERGQASVEELAEAVGLTQMAVRHHLNVLHGDNLIVFSSVRRKSQPGRPQQLYSLSDSASRLFPEDYYHLAGDLLDEAKTTLGTDGLDELMSRVADRMAAEAPQLSPALPPEERMGQLVQYLRDKGFTARWGIKDDDYVIRVLACPYRQVAHAHSQVCRLDRQIIRNMLGTEPVRVTCIASGDEHCTYHISQPEVLATDP